MPSLRYPFNKAVLKFFHLVESTVLLPGGLKQIADFVFKNPESVNFLLQECVGCFILELQICYQPSFPKGGV